MLYRAEVPEAGEPPRFDGGPPRAPKGAERMSQYGDDGEEEASPASLVHPGVQSRHGRAVPGR